MPLKYFRSRRRGRALLGRPTEIEEPISADIFSVERLEHYAETLAKTQEISPAPQVGISLRKRLRSNAGTLNGAYHALIEGMREARAMTPAAEWLIDNYYIVDEHIRAIRRDLPPGYYKQLPKLAGGSLRGYPRVYGLAWALVAHSDHRFELDTLLRFVRAYQRVQPLTIGELWAIAITLRVVLIDNLSRLAAGIVHRLTLRDEADALADELLPSDPDPAQAAVAVRMPDTSGPLPSAFAAQLFQRLRDQDPATTPALQWLHSRLATQKTTADDIVHREHQDQGAVNVSVRNIITSLRLISSVDWAKFFEGVSLVDETLRDQSAFGSFDFATRDSYRHAIEELARRSNHTELDVALRAVEAARSAGRALHAESEPGYYLVSAGRAELERKLGYSPPWNESCARGMRAAGVTGYVTAIALVSLAVTAVFLLAVDAAPARISRSAAHSCCSPSWRPPILVPPS